MPRQPPQLGGAPGGVVGHQTRGCRGDARAQAVAVRRQAAGLLPGGHLRTRLLTVQNRGRPGKCTNHSRWNITCIPDRTLKAGRSSQPRDAPPAHVARAALLVPHGGRDGPGHGEHGGGAGLLAAG